MSSGGWETWPAAKVRAQPTPSSKLCSPKTHHLPAEGGINTSRYTSNGGELQSHATPWMQFFLSLYKWILSKHLFNTFILVSVCITIVEGSPHVQYLAVWLKRRLKCKSLFSSEPSLRAQNSKIVIRDQQPTKPHHLTVHRVADLHFLNLSTALFLWHFC